MHTTECVQNFLDRGFDFREPPERFIAHERVRSDPPKFAFLKKSIMVTQLFCKKEEKRRSERVRDTSRSSSPQKSAERSKKSTEPKRKPDNKKMTKLKKDKEEEKKEEEEEKQETPVEDEFVSVSDSSDVSESSPSSLQCFVVTDPSRQSPPLLNPRVKVIKKFVAEIPRHCKEARLGDKHGSFECPQKFPGIPEKKFSQLNGKRADQNTDKDWPIQAIYKDEGDNPEKVLVYYEGWTSFYLFPTTRTDVKESAPLLLDCLDVRLRFVDAMRRKANDEYKALKEEQGCYDPNAIKENDQEYRFLFVEPKEKTNPNSSFWYFEDLTYFHSIINSDLNLAPIFYMALCEPRTAGKNIMPPNYKYTAVNLIPREVYDFLMEENFNKSYNQLIRGRRLFFSGHKNVCPSPGCVCDRIFPLLYRGKEAHVQKLKFTANGRLDVSDYHTRKARLLIECSDRCGCDASCPRRALQRGQRKPLVVNYQPGVGYGLRTAEHIYAGELICEYTGEMMFIDSEPTRSEEENPKKARRQQDEKSKDEGNEEKHEEVVASKDRTHSVDNLVWRPAVRKLQPMKPRLATSSAQHSSQSSSERSSLSSSGSPSGSSSYENSPPDDMFAENTSAQRTKSANKKKDRLRKPRKSKVVPRRMVVTAHSEQDCIEDSDRTSTKAKNTSYEAGFSVMTTNLSICALETGNIARFMNHGCNPNAMFVECHSRRSEKDPLMPRIGVFAKRDIPLGDEVLVSYWTDEQLKSAILSNIPCKCGADNCIKLLPGSIDT